MDGGAWWATVHGVAKSPTRLVRGSAGRNLSFPFCKTSLLELELSSSKSVCVFRIVKKDILLGINTRNLQSKVE